MGTLVRGYDTLINALAVLAGCSVVAMLFLIFADVTIRSFGIALPPFGVTLVEYALIYFTVLAAPYLVRIKGHVAIELVVNAVPAAVAVWMRRIVAVVSAAACLVFAGISADILIETYNSHRLDVRGIDVPLWLSFAPLPLSFLLVAIEFLRGLFVREPSQTDGAVADKGF